MTKTELENVIYQCGAPVYDNGGRWSSPAASPLLQALLSVYNRFFFRQNRAFLALDIKQTQTDCQAAQKAHQNDLRRSGPLAVFFRLESYKNEVISMKNKCENCVFSHKPFLWPFPADKVFCEWEDDLVPNTASCDRLNNK